MSIHDSIEESESRQAPDSVQLLGPLTEAAWLGLLPVLLIEAEASRG